MNIYPYVYRVDHPSGEFYIGYRAANKVPATDDLGHKYKTSTKHLSYPFEEYSITIIAEFFTGTAKTDAYDFEQLTIFEYWGDPNLANKACHYENKQRFSMIGQKLTDEHREKLSEALRGKIRKAQSDAHRAKISEAKRGKTHSAETKKKMSETRLGQKHSAEHRAKISEAQRGQVRKKHSDESRAKMSESAKRRVLLKQKI